ncbi:MAG: hypothetical protein VBE63_17660 [Lamprobacter sp.]|uniref:hypothetical protein n=1 Tax=Lamprobacter sp. TaxID=3100796 RepID=UPI002B262094|nr:hypothetical protein [Lamprobacter sp.]MEA3641744.1 hypothetical protein [Lamprobacter sp.]
MSRAEHSVCSVHLSATHRHRIALAGVEEIVPATLRRNLLVFGINLAALKGQR